VARNRRANPTSALINGNFKVYAKVTTVGTAICSVITPLAINLIKGCGWHLPTNKRLGAVCAAQVELIPNPKAAGNAVA
jgi:hypothetical protein